MPVPVLVKPLAHHLKIRDPHVLFLERQMVHHMSRHPLDPRPPVHGRTLGFLGRTDQICLRDGVGIVVDLQVRVFELIERGRVLGGRVLGFKAGVNSRGLKLKEIAGVVGFDGFFERGVVCVEGGGFELVGVGGFLALDEFGVGELGKREGGKFAFLDVTFLF